MKTSTKHLLVVITAMLGLVAFALGVYVAYLESQVEFENNAANISRLTAHKVNIDLRTIASMNEDNPMAFLEAPTIAFIPQVTQTLIEDDISRLKQSKGLSDAMQEKFRTHFAKYRGFVAGGVLRVVSVELDEKSCSVMNDPKPFNSIADLVKEKINLKKGTTFCYVMTAETLTRMKYPSAGRDKVYFAAILTAVKSTAPKAEKKSEKFSSTSFFL